jgi:Rrf2 family nitric oxide-sensitive transcriptional repressor
MQLTRFTDYALRALIYLGAHRERLSTISEVAAAYDISEAHLMKVVNRLATAGYIETLRGKGGGLRLSREPHLINLGDVVRDTEDNMNIVECFDPTRQSCPLVPACTLKSVLIEARRNFMATLDRYTLRDVLSRQTVAILAGSPRAKIPAVRAPST